MRRTCIAAAAIVIAATPVDAQNPPRQVPPVVGGLKAPTMPPPPTISYGQPQAAPTGRAVSTVRWEARSITALVGGRNTSAQILHLRGLDGIEKAQGLPDGARRLLSMHVRTLKQGEPDHYIVNPQLAAEWLKTHPVPDDIKPAKPDNHEDCDAFSIHCAQVAGQHVVDQATAEWQKLWQQAVDAWKHAQKELAKEWNTIEGCFADTPLPLANIPVKFAITPSYTVKLEEGGTTKAGGGSGSGTVTGTVGVGLPIQSDFTAQLDLFYIPCLPFVVRPRSIGANGLMTVGERITANVSATGTFAKTFTIPPSGGPQIPIQVIPIVIGGVPVAELDVSAYIEGNIEVGGKGKADGSFQLDNPHRAQFEFSCSGSGCSSRSKNIPDPTTATETASIKGQVYVKPAIYTALQLNFDFDALSARAGPQPYLIGTASGCDAVAGSQTSGGASTSSENHILAADLDWAVELRAEALIAHQIVGQSFVQSITKEKHLWFKDLLNGGSTSLVALVTGPVQTPAAKAATYRVRMPSCYPYSSPVKYRVTWTGNATPAPSEACKWAAGQGTCTLGADKDAVIALVWPTPGSYTVSVVATGDDHDRVFTPQPKPTVLNVTVGAASSGGGGR